MMQTQSTVRAFKTPKGLSLVELLVTISILMIVISAIFLLIHPDEQQAKSRDNKRMSDLTTLDRAVSEYVMDNGAYPDAVNTLRTSAILPQGQTGPLQQVSSGWIVADFSKYLSNLPTDPVNNATYFYSYKHTNSGYELNAKVEFYTTDAQNDGGNSATLYEIGNDLTIL